MVAETQSKNQPEPNRRQDLTDQKSDADDELAGGSTAHAPAREFQLVRAGQAQETMIQTQLAYWKDELGDVPTLDMVLDRTRPPVLSGAYDTVCAVLDTSTIDALRLFCADKDAPLLAALVSVYAACLCRHSGQEEVVVGLELEKNLVGLRIDFSQSPSFEQLLARTRLKLLSARANNDVPLEDVVAALGLQADPARTPVFQAMLGSGLDGDAAAKASSAAGQFEFDLQMREDGSGNATAELHFAADLYTRATAERFAGHLATLARAVLAEPRKAMDELGMLTAAEEAQLQRWNETDVDFGAFERVERMFAAQAVAAPGAPALMQDQNAWSYGEVDALAEALAGELRGRCGVRRGDNVGLMMPRSREMYVAVLGVLKCGAAIVPVDVDHTPADRAQYMLVDCSVRVVVLGARYGEYLQSLQPQCMALVWEEAEPKLRERAAQSSAEAKEEEAAEGDGDAVFGIFYTSGTTGRPKGVRVLQRNVFNLAKAFGKFNSVQPADRVLQFSSYSFIMSLRQIWPTLTHGACLVVIERPLELEAVINANQVTKLVITASALSILHPARVPSLRAVQLGGERVSKSLAQTWGGVVDFKVGLGPTELTAHAMCNARVTADVDQVTIGHPHDNVRCYITNGKMQQQPVGVIGELCLAGANVTGGYLNSPELSDAKFMPDPFAGAPRFPSLFRTGDLAVRLEDGTVLFKGRRDDQVKINGYRIELGEIQRVAETAPGTKDVAVLLREEQIVCYLTPADVDTAALCEHMAARVPYYMVPAHFVALDKFPLNKNSKLDRTALPAPQPRQPPRTDGGGDDDALSSPTEERVAAAFVQTLRLGAGQGLRRTDGFFALGGTSLTAVVLTRELQAEFGVEVPVTLLFDTPDIASIAAQLAAIAQGSGQQPTDQHYFAMPGVAALPKADGLGLLPGRVGGRRGEAPMGPWWFAGVQYACLAWLVGITLLPGVGGVLGFWYALVRSEWPLQLGMVACAGVLLGAAALHGLLILVTKWVVVGRLQPGLYPMYSKTFLRWWFNRKLMWSSRVWVWLLNETALLPLWYRGLGARVGRNASMDDVVMDEPDLVSLGDDFQGRAECVLATSEVVRRVLVLRPVSAGHGVRLGLRAVLMPGTHLPDAVRLLDAAAVGPRTTIHMDPATAWAGAMATLVGPVDRTEAPAPAFLHSWWYAAAQVAALLVLVFVAQWPLIGLTHLAKLLADTLHLRYASALVATCGTVVAGAGYFVVVVAAKWLLVGRVRADVLYASPLFFLRKWMVDRLMVNPLFKAFQLTLLDPSCSVAWLFGALGVRIGARPWINPPMVRTGCDLVELGQEPHMGQENILFTDVLSADGVRFVPIRVGDFVTFGQRTVCSPGASIGKHSTVGACSFVPRDAAVHRESTVFGNPPNIFSVWASSETVTKQTQALAEAAAAQDSSSSHSHPQAAAEASLGVVTVSNASSVSFPSDAVPKDASPAADVDVPGRIARTGSVDSLVDLRAERAVPLCRHVAFAVVAVLSQVVEPAVMFSCWSLLFEAFAELLLRRSFGVSVAGEPLWLFLVIPLCALSGIAAVLLLLLALNVAGFLQFRKGQISYFGLRFMSWHLCAEIVLGWTNGVMKVFSGTGFYNWFLRRMGAEVGKGVFMDPVSGGFRELNHMFLEDGAVVLTHTVHAHYIDHGKLQFAPVRIGRNVCVNAGCIVMPLTKYGENCTLRPYTFTIKAQELGEDRVYQGNPAEQSHALQCLQCALTEVFISEH